jgi:short-subunit dehydrogenase
MARAGSGRIVNIGSLTGFTPVPLRGIYSATKGAVMRLSDALRLELGMLGIQVNTGQAFHSSNLEVQFQNIY